MIYKYFKSKPTGVIGDGIHQCYYTCNSYDSPTESKNYIAVPYEPLYRVKIDMGINRNLEDICDSFEDERSNELIRRAWAAFGLHGGAWEFITKKQFMQSREIGQNLQYSGQWGIDKILFSCGHAEEYSTFKKPTEHAEIIQLLIQFLKGYQGRGERGEFGEVKEIFRWKVPDDSIGGIFYWVANSFEYTISVLVKAHEDIYNGLKLWGTFWKDQNDIRYVHKSIELTIPGFPVIKKYEIESDNNLCAEFDLFLNKAFDNLRETLVDKSRMINRLTDYITVPLPARTI